MKILFITQFLPYYPDTGGKIKTWGILKILSKKRQVFLVSFVDKKEDLVYEKKLREICFGVKTFVQPIITQAHRDLKIKAFLSLLSLKPFRALKHYSKEMEEFIRKINKKQTFDVIYIDHDVMIQYLGAVSTKNKALVFYDEHNISSLAAWRNFLIEKNPIDKLAYLLETTKWVFYEQKYLSHFNHIFAISRLDKKRLIKRGINPKKVSFLPIPIEIEPLFKFNPKEKNILFIGLMSWKPNNDGFWWFYKEIFPAIKKEIADVRLTVIGAYPSKSMREAAKIDDNLEFLGYVKNLIPYFKKTSVFIAPIRSGGGIRIKILDALSRGVPVVSTTVGVEGIEAKNKREMIIADRPRVFAQAVIEILEDRKLAQRLSKGGIKFIQNKYSPKRTKRILKKVLSKGK